MKTCAKIFSKSGNFSCFINISTFLSNFLTIESLGFLITASFWKLELVVMFSFTIICEARFACVSFFCQLSFDRFSHFLSKTLTSLILVSLLSVFAVVCSKTLIHCVYPIRNALIGVRGSKTCWKVLNAFSNFSPLETLSKGNFCLFSKQLLVY